jgi:hypothetical protein
VASGKIGAFRYHELTTIILLFSPFAQFAQSVLERGIGFAHAELADLLPASLNLGLKFILVLSKVIERGADLPLIEFGKARPDLFDTSPVGELVEYNFNDLDLCAANPGNSTAVRLN